MILFGVNSEFRFLEMHSVFETSILTICLAHIGAGGEEMMQQRVFCCLIQPFALEFTGLITGEQGDDQEPDSLRSV